MQILTLDESLESLRSFEAAVPNLWHAYSWGYGGKLVGEYNIGNDGEYQEKGVKIKTQKQSYRVLIYKERNCESSESLAHRWS